MTAIRSQVDTALASAASCGSLQVTNHEFACTSNFVWNSVSPLAGSVTSASNIEGVWMNQGVGKRRNTIDYALRVQPRDEDMRHLLMCSETNLSLQVSLHVVNKLTMQPDKLIDTVDMTSKRARASGAERDLCGEGGALVCPQFGRDCSLRLVPNKKDGCLYASVPVRIETTSLKHSRCEFVVTFTLKSIKQDSMALPLLFCAPAESRPVFVVSKIRTPHHYRHDKSIAKLRDVHKRLENKCLMNDYTKAWAKQMQGVAKQVVEAVQAAETVEADYAPIEKRKRALENEMFSSFPRDFAMRGGAKKLCVE
jgi:hypothetical protein